MVIFLGQGTVQSATEVREEDVQRFGFAGGDPAQSRREVPVGGERAARGSASRPRPHPAAGSPGANPIPARRGHMWRDTRGADGGRGGGVGCKGAASSEARGHINRATPTFLPQ